MNFLELKRLRCRPVPDHMSGVISEDNMSLELLKVLFDATSHATLIHDQLGLIVKGDKTIIDVSLGDSPENRFLRFASRVPFKQSSTLEQRLAFLAQLNSDKLLIRYSLLDTVLYCDYFLSYEDGILPHTITNSYFRFHYCLHAMLYENCVLPGGMLDFKWE